MYNRQVGRYRYTIHTGFFLSIIEFGISESLPEQTSHAMDVFHLFHYLLPGSLFLSLLST